MGCGGSRLQNPESIPVRFRPILRRRIEEVRRRRRLVSTKDESTKKELLPEDDKPNEADHRKSSVGKGDCSLASSCMTSSEGGSKGKEEGSESKVVADGGHQGSDHGTPDLEDDATDDDDNVMDDSSIFYAASPSFRIYFVDNGDDSDNDDDKDHSFETVKEEAIEEKIQNSDSDALPEKEPGTKKVEKKVRKRSLKKVIPRGGQAAIKNLLNVTTCYTPPCRVTRHDRTLLLSEKSQP